MNKCTVTQKGDSTKIEVETDNARLDEVIADMFKGLLKASKAQHDE